MGPYGPELRQEGARLVEGPQGGAWELSTAPVENLWRTRIPLWETPREPVENWVWRAVENRGRVRAGERVSSRQVWSSVGA